MLLQQPLHPSAHTTCTSQDTLLGAFCHVGGSLHVNLDIPASFTIADAVSTTLHAPYSATQCHCVFLHFAVAHDQNKLHVGAAAGLNRKRCDWSRESGRKLFRKPVQQRTEHQVTSHRRLIEKVETIVPTLSLREDHQEHRAVANGINAKTRSSVPSAHRSLPP